MLLEKYKPKSLEDIVGQKEAVSKILKWYKSWKPGDKALLLYGTTGIGKTSILEALASQENMDFIELNASDYRSAKQIREYIGGAVAQTSLFKKGKIFVIDEVDALSGRSDRGGPGEIIKMIEETMHPIALTANSPYMSKLKSLRKRCRMVELNEISVEDIERKLMEIIKKEGLSIERDAIREIAKRSEGDLRAAINDLDTLKSKKRITINDVDDLGERERGVDIYEALNKIFKADTVYDARRSLDGVDKQLDDVFWWIETNVTEEYKRPDEIADAFDALSKADIFRQMIRKTGNWRFLAYVVDMMTGGVAVAKKKKYFHYVNYQYPTMIATLGRTKFSRKKRDEKLEELSKKLHCSKRKVITEFLPYFDDM